MIPKDKIEAIIAKYINLEKELSSGNLDPKHYASKSKEYSDLSNIVECAKKFLSFE